MHDKDCIVMRKRVRGKKGKTRKIACLTQDNFIPRNFWLMRWDKINYFVLSPSKQKSKNSCFVLPTIIPNTKYPIYMHGLSILNTHLHSPQNELKREVQIV